VKQNRPSVSAEAAMRERPHDGLPLFSRAVGRKYLNMAEQRRFLATACRSRALVLQGACIDRRAHLGSAGWASIDIESGTLAIHTKRRKRGVVRQVPLLSDLLDELDAAFDASDAQRDADLAIRRIWTAWRCVEGVMVAAGITGGPAMPKGLRHWFAVNAFQSNVPPHLVQRWLGHASLRTTAIYADVSAALTRVRLRRGCGEISAHQLGAGKIRFSLHVQGG
jgi:integrase/recombinase XerD